jgi:hypothetical protein
MEAASSVFSVHFYHTVAAHPRRQQPSLIFKCLIFPYYFIITVPKRCVIRTWGGPAFLFQCSERVSKEGVSDIQTFLLSTVVMFPNVWCKLNFVLVGIADTLCF